MRRRKETSALGHGTDEKNLQTAVQGVIPYYFFKIIYRYGIRTKREQKDDKQKGSGFIERFKNPALSRENGVLTAYCCQCGKYIGNEYDTNFYALIRRKYCEEHAQEFHKIQMAISRKTYKAKKQKTVREMQSVLDETIKTVRIQRDYILSLQRQIDDMKRGIV